MKSGNRRAILAALGANLGLAIAKAVGFVITGASAMLAEAVHSLADSGNQALLLWGGAQARRSPDPERPFGYGRERYFWSFVVSLVIFSLGGLFAIYEGAQKLLHPHPLNRPEVALIILLVGMALEGASFRTAIVESRAIKGESSWWEFIRHSKSPELPVVLLEDLGALLGLVIAFGGIGIAAWTGDPRYDGMGSIAIGALLLAVAVVLAVEMKSLLIGEAASPTIQQEIMRVLSNEHESERVIALRTTHLGPDQLLVGAKIQMRADLSFQDVANAIDRMEAHLRAAVPIARFIYIEPDVYAPDRAREDASS